MSTHVPNPFSSPDTAGDTQAVLVLLESSAEMPSFWGDIRDFHLPTLFEALQRGSPGVPIQISWQTTADVPGQSPYSHPARQVPDFFPAAGPPPPAAPLSTAHLQRAAEVLRAVSRAKGSTRHLIVVAVSPSTDQAGFQALASGFADVQQPVQALLQQERIRLHMVLSANPRQQVLRHVHSHMLRVQGHIAAPLWFPVDPTKYSIHLAAKPSTFSGGEPSPLLVPAPSGASSNLVAPAVPAISLPALHSALESPVPASSASAPASPPTRRSRAKAKEAAASAEAGAPSLVNYLKQIHGLTKKRNYSAKSSKRSATSDMPRPSTSSRPILPRLDLPSVTLPASATTDPKGKQPSASAGAEPGPSRPRYAPIAPAIHPTRPSEDTRRAQGRRWPWLHPPHVGSSPDAPGTSAGGNSALSNLGSLQPRGPGFSGQFVGDMPPSMGRGPPQSAPGAPGVPQSMRPGPIRRQSTHPPYGMSGSPPSPHIPSPMYAQSTPEYHGDLARGSPVYNSPPAPRELSSSLYPQQPHHGAYTYTPPYGGSQTSSPQPSPSMTAPVAAPDDAENQPFVVTPEYEAFANAQFEHALRSGAMHASMTPGAPVATASPPGYFTRPADAMMSPPLQQQPQAGSSLSYPYPQNAAQPLRNDVLYHQSSGTSTPSDPPADGTHYYPPQPEGDPSHRRW